MVNTTISGKKRPLDLWDKIEIVIERDGQRGLYMTRVEDIGPNKIIASKPEFVDGNRLLVENAAVYVQFRKPDAMYRYAARIKSRPGKDDTSVELHLIGKMERVQRRNFVRIDMKIGLKFSLLKKSDISNALQDPCWHDSFSKNVSAGGMLMNVGEDVEKGDILMVRIGDNNITGLPRLLTVLCCRIVSFREDRFAGVEFIKNENLHLYFTRNEISSLPSQIQQFDNNVQNKMVRFVFERQVKERQKGLI
ncbi:MAG: PilZ domain-containing protein [Candidatus Zixiibacteriota bacterium]